MLPDKGNTPMSSQNAKRKNALALKTNEKGKKFKTMQGKFENTGQHMKIPEQRISR